MWLTLFVRQVLLVCCFLLLSLAACAPEAETRATPTVVVSAATATKAVATITTTSQPVSTPTSLPSSPTAAITATVTLSLATAEAAPLPATPTMPLPEPSSTAASSAPAGAPVVVAYLKGGDVHLWDETTQQSEMIFNADNAGSVLMSEDGQVMVFSRNWVEQIGDNECGQSALWAVDRNGENARELISSDNLRQYLGVPEQCTPWPISFSQVEWLPQTHRLVFSATPEEEHASPHGVYLLDTETPSASELVPAEHSLYFVPSPDSRQIALMSTTELSFINADGSNWRRNVLTYPQVGVPIPLLPTGVWTEDGRAFLIVAPIESESEFELNYTIIRVLVDGSAAQPLATLSNSHGLSVTFSPDGRFASFLQELNPWEWFITPLAAEVGPLAIPYAAIDPYTSIHWPPAGAAFTINEGNLFQLCPDATRSSQVCGQPVHLGHLVGSFRWLNSKSFLFITHEEALVLGRLDGTKIPIVTWPEGPASFSAVVFECTNDSEFVLDVNVPDGTQVAAGALFTKTWRLRNSGACTWDASFTLDFVDGEQMAGPQSLAIAENVPPGGEIDLSVNLTAPLPAGTYRGRWQLAAPDGTLFGIKPYVEIVVP